MNILLNKNLRPFNSFSIDVNADVIIEANSINDFIDIWSNDDYRSSIKLPLGRGSNTLFCNDFSGVIVLNRILGKEVTETETDYLLSVSSGEDWPSFVKWCVEHNYNGIENLAMIPGCVGSAPIQNIGAYGLEFKDVCDYVEYLDLESLNIKRLSKSECDFGYRESIFKKSLKDKVIITSVGFKLSKSWAPLLTYGPLADLGSVVGVTAKSVFKAICDIRSLKLPNPEVLGNAGSFFKNPIVSDECYLKLSKKFPTLPAYTVSDGKKIAAGWLIDHAGLKGFSINDAQVHKEQALVLINNGNATSKDILELARHVQKTIFDIYHIELEHEVRFYFSGKETSLSELFE